MGFQIENHQDRDGNSIEGDRVFLDTSAKSLNHSESSRENRDLESCDLYFL